MIVDIYASIRKCGHQSWKIETYFTELILSPRVAWKIRLGSESMVYVMNFTCESGEGGTHEEDKKLSLFNRVIKIGLIWQSNYVEIG